MLKGQSFNRYELDETEKPASPEMDTVKELFDTITGRIETANTEPTVHKKITVRFMDGLERVLISCQIRTTNNFVHFYTFKTNEELVVAIRCIEYYICEGIKHRPQGVAICQGMSKDQVENNE